MKTHWVKVSIAAGLLTALAIGCDRLGSAKTPAAPQRPPAPVTVTEAIAKNVPVYIERIGRTTARESVTIQPQVGGAIMQIHFQDGAQLKQGELLFTIDPRPYDAALKQAQATVSQDQADVAWAQSELDRVKGLANTGAVSKSDIESKENALAVAQAKVQAGEAAVITAKLNLDYCTIRSPIDGRAGQRLVDQGNIVQTGGPDGGTKLLTIQRLDPIYADFTLPEQDLHRVREQMKKGTLKTEVWLPEEVKSAPPREGELTFLDNAVSNDTGTIKLRATLPNKDSHFWPGQFVQVRLVLEVLNDAVLVPTIAQQLSQTGPFVYVVKEGEVEDPQTKQKSKATVAEQRPVKLGQRQGDMVVVLDGVKAGEQVITEGQMMVRPGAAVHVVPVTNAPPAPGSPTSKPAAVAEGAH